MAARRCRRPPMRGVHWPPSVPPTRPTPAPHLPSEGQNSAIRVVKMIGYNKNNTIQYDNRQYNTSETIQYDNKQYNRSKTIQYDAKQYNTKEL